MIKEERITKRSIVCRVKENIETLEASNHTIEDIFNVSFSHENFTFFNLVKNSSLVEISYGDAKQKTQEFAGFFSKNIEKKSKFVGLLLENCPEWIYSYYGLLMAGFIPVLLSTAAPNEESLSILHELGGEYIVTNKVLDVKTINPFLITENLPIENPCWENKVVFITSGTSGKPKIFMYTGEELSQQLFNTIKLIEDYPLILSIYKGYAKQLLILPLYHIFGFCASFLWFSFFNITFVIPSSLAPDNIKEACLLGKPTHLFAVPLFWEVIVKKILQKVKEKNKTKLFERIINLSISIQKHHPKKGASFVKNHLLKKYVNEILGKSPGFCIAGGTAISSETLRIINGLGYPLFNGYGSTEIGISSFANPQTIKSRMSLTIGKPFKNHKYELSENGELLVYGKSSYYAEFINGEFVVRDNSLPIPSNDFCKIENGNYYLEGRKDEIFIGKNGENHSLSQIEKSIQSLYADDLVCVPSNNKIFLVLSYSKNLTPDLIKEDLSNVIRNENFVKYSISRIFITNNTLPKANGVKIKRNQVSQMVENNEFMEIYASQQIEMGNDIDYNHDALNKVIEIFKEVTNAPNIKMHSDFFLELGGDSLSYFDLVSKIESTFELVTEVNIEKTRTPLQFTLKLMEQAEKENKPLKTFASSGEINEKSPEKIVKFRLLHFLSRAIIKITGFIPYLIFVTPRFFYYSLKAKKESKHVKEGAILIGNHSSTFDYVTLVFKYWFKVVHTFVGPAIYRFKSLTHLCNIMENIEVKKDDPNVNALKTAEYYLNKNKVIAIFPEGHFEDNPGEIGEFSPSAIKLAFETGKPIIPFYFKGNYGLFKRSKINVGEKIYVRDLINKKDLDNEDLIYLTDLVRAKVKKLKHQLYCFETHKTQSRFSFKLFVSDLMKVTGFPFGYLVFWARKKYVGDKKRIKKAMKEKVLLAPTHTSFFDVVFMYLYFVTRRLRVFALKNAVRQNRFYPLIHGAGVIEYDRDAKGGFDLRAFKETDEILEGNGCVVMFPQGHIIEEGNLNKGTIKQGLAVHSIRQNAPIIPIIFKKETRFLRPNIIYVGDPIYPSEHLENVNPIKENIEKFTELVQRKMIELQSISKKS